MKQKIHLRKSQEKDVLIIILLNLLGATIAYLGRNTFLGKPLVVAILLILFPTVFLLKRKKINWKETIASTLVVGGIWGFMADFVGEFTGMWNVLPHNLIFPYKILGVEPVDNTLWWVMMTFYTLLFYQNFVDSEKRHKVSKHLKLLVGLSFSSLLILVFVFLLNPVLLKVAYPYFTMGCIAIILPVISAFLKPQIFTKMVTTGVYFFCLYFLYEIFAVTYTYWIYNGHYVGLVTIFGLSFPFEELFFWMMLYAPVIIAYHEVFVDNCS